MQDWLVHIYLGLIQGLTEFLPVSSSGHLLLAEKLFGFDEERFATFAVLLHASTALAVIVYFWKYLIGNLAALVVDTKSLPDNHPKRSEAVKARGLWKNWLIATAMLVLLLPVKDYVGNYNHYKWSLLATSGVWLITAALMISLDRIQSKSNLAAHQLPFWKAMIIGLAQDLSAILRGLSRSGSTVFACVAVGMNRPDAAKFSFLLSLAAIGAAVVVDLDNISSIPSQLIGPTLAGCLAAFISGLIGIHYLLKLLVAARTAWFGYWCILMSAVAAATYFYKYH